MGVLAKLYTFVAGAVASPSEVNVNFDDIIGFINTQVVHTDGSKAMSQHLAGPATDPTTANQYTRKAYVDGQVATATTALAQRLKALAGGTWTVRSTGGSVDPTTVQMQFVATTAVLTSNVNGAATVSFPAAFPNECVSVIVSNADTDSNALLVGTTAVTKSGFDVTLEPSPGAGAGFRINYIAIGY